MVRGADADQEVEGNIAGCVIASGRWTPRGQRSQGMCGTFMRENREIPWLPVRLIIGRAVQARLWR